jgi:hypothetical protein
MDRRSDIDQCIRPTANRFQSLADAKDRYMPNPDFACAV